VEKEEICPICNKGKFVKVKKTLKNTEISAFSCGHQKVSMTILVPNPIKVLQEAINQKDWFRGIIMSATFFERLGIKKLKEHFQSNGINVDQERIERLELERIIIFLYGCGAIDQNTYAQMFQIKNKRDDLVHKVMPTFELNDGEAKRLIEKAIECVKKLL